MIGYMMFNYSPYVNCNKDDRQYTDPLILNVNMTCTGLILLIKYLKSRSTPTGAKLEAKFVTFFANGLVFLCTKN